MSVSVSLGHSLSLAIFHLCISVSISVLKTKPLKSLYLSIEPRKMVLFLSLYHSTLNQKQCYILPCIKLYVMSTVLMTNHFTLAPWYESKILLDRLVNQQKAKHMHYAALQLAWKKRKDSPRPFACTQLALLWKKVIL